MLRDDGLTDREGRFCTAYMLDANGTQAAIQAGYAPRSAHVTASRLLRKAKVATRIAELRRAQERRTHVSADRVIAELARLAFASLRPFLRVDADGQVHLDLAQTDPVLLDAVQAVAFETILRPEPGQPTLPEIRKVKIRMHDKLRALRLLARHTGVFAPSPKSSSADTSLADAFRQIEGHPAAAAPILLRPAPALETSENAE